MRRTFAGPGGGGARAGRAGPGGRRAGHGRRLGGDAKKAAAAALLTGPGRNWRLAALPPQAGEGKVGVFV